MEGERHTTKTWGRHLSDMDGTPLTLQEVQTQATMAIADKLCEIAVILENMQSRLYRMESWMEENFPGYRDTRAYHPNTGENEGPHAHPAALSQGRSPARR